VRRDGVKGAGGQGAGGHQAKNLIRRQGVKQGEGDEEDVDGSVVIEDG